MKIHLRKERRGEGFRLQFEYNVGDSKIVLQALPHLERAHVRETVAQTVAGVRKAKSLARQNGVAQVNPGGQT